MLENMRKIKAPELMTAAIITGLALCIAAYAVAAPSHRLGMALRATARWSFLWFCLATYGGALSALFGSRFQPLARRGRDFGLTFASAHLVHLGLVAWLLYNSTEPFPRLELVIFAIGVFCTYVLAAFSLSATLSGWLGPRLWKNARAIAVEYIVFAFAFDFARHLGGSWTNLLLYSSLFAAALAGPVLRLTASIKRRPKGGDHSGAAAKLIDISIVMATYRRPTSIVDAIRSILDQRGVRVEVLVVDDCPNGSAEPVVLGIGDPRVRYIRNPNPSKGRPAVPRNVGWPQTSADIIHFADDDDLVPEGLYAEALQAFRRFPNIGLVFGSIEAFGEPSKTLSDEQALFARAARRASRLQRLASARAFAANLLFNELLFVGGSTLIRRRCLVALGGLPTDAEIMEDVDFLARATRLFGVRYLNRCSLFYRVWPSMMHRQHDLQAALNRSYRRLQSGYRETFGAFDYYLLKIAARTVFRWI